MFLHQLAGLLVVKVSPLVGHFAMRFGYRLTCSFTAMAPAFLARQSTLFAFQIRLCFPRVARCFDKRSIREGGEVSDTQVYAHFTLHFWQWGMLFNFTG